MVNDDTRSADGRGGRATQRGANQEEGWRSSAEGAQDSPGEARAPNTAGGGVEDPTHMHHIRAFSTPEGGAAPSKEEGADLQVFTPAMAHLSLREVYGVPPHNTTTGCT